MLPVRFTGRPLAAFGIALIVLVCVDGRAANDRPLLFGMNPTWGSWAGYDGSWYDPRMMDKIVDAGGTCIRSGIWLGAENGSYAADLALERQMLFVACICGGTVPPPEESAALFQSSITQFATLYRGRVRHYEFWNEPDYIGGWEPTPDAAAYTRWLQRCYTAVKAGDPDALVSVGGLLIPDLRFLRAIYDHGGRSYFDAVALHPYYSDDGGFPVLNAQMIRDCRDLLVARGDGHKEIWITEYGWNSRWVGDSDKANRMRSALDLLTSDTYQYVTLATYHTISDFDISGAELYGLCDRHLTPRQAYNVFAGYAKPPWTPRPTRTPTRTPSPTPVGPTPTPTPRPPGSLINPGFESWSLGAETADGWTRWRRSGACGWGIEQNWWVTEGKRSQQVMSNPDAYNAGVYQEVPAVVGQTYTFEAMVGKYCDEYQRDWNLVRRYIGIDPGGGADYQDVQWVAESQTYVEWSTVPWERMSATATARSDKITVMLRVESTNPTLGGNRYGFFDDARLYGGPVPTDTPAGPQTPTATPSPLPPGERLVNGGFEDDGDDFANPPSGWSGWADVESADGTLQSTSWLPYLTLPVRTGQFGAGKVTNYGMPQVGFYQRVAVTPGIRYACSAWIRTPRTDTWGEGEIRLGVDLSGGTDPYSGAIVWTDWQSSVDAWRRIGFVADEALVAMSTQLTLFIAQRQTTSRAWNAMLVDDASVWPLEPAGATLSAF